MVLIDADGKLEIHDIVYGKLEIHDMVTSNQAMVS
jgi:hypothetical protein